LSWQASTGLWCLSDRDTVTVHRHAGGVVLVAERLGHVAHHVAYRGDMAAVVPEVLEVLAERGARIVEAAQ
jgi:hypothetical protein